MAKAVIFDLDGTLVDSAPDLHAVANTLLAENGAGPVSLEAVTSFIGHGVPNLVERIFSACGRKPAKNELSAHVERFLEIYSAAPVRLSRLYPGVEAALTRLFREGYQLGICTNKAEAVARKVVAGTGLGIYIRTIAGGGRTKEKKPDPSSLIVAASETGADLADVIYVGDSETDAATASAARVPFLLYTKGYRQTPVDELAHDGLFDDFEQLFGLVSKLAAKQA